MEIREIEVFLALAEELHFSRTAARLHVTQGRVSQTIRALEREVGGALFERTSRTVRLTPLGERFRDGTRPGYDQLTRTLRECRESTRELTGVLRISYLPSIGSEVVIRFASAFEKSHPRCQVQVNTRQFLGASKYAEVLEGETDLVLIWSPGGTGEAVETPGITVGPVLGTVGRAVLTRADHPLAKRPDISVEDLAEYELINPDSTWPPKMRHGASPVITPSGRPIRHTSEDIAGLSGRADPTLTDVMTQVARGYGLHCTIETVLKRSPFPGMAAVPIRDLPPMALVPIWRTGRATAATEAFVAIAASLRDSH